MADACTSSLVRSGCSESDASSDSRMACSSFYTSLLRIDLDASRRSDSLAASTEMPNYRKPRSFGPPSRFGARATFCIVRTESY